MKNEILISENNRQIIYNPNEKVKVSVTAYDFAKIEGNLNNQELSRMTRKKGTFVLAEIEARDLKIGQSILCKENKYKGYRIR